MKRGERMRERMVKTLGELKKMEVRKWSESEREIGDVECWKVCERRRGKEKKECKWNVLGV